MQYLVRPAIVMFIALSLACGPAAPAAAPVPSAAKPAASGPAAAPAEKPASSGPTAASADKPAASGAPAPAAPAKAAGSAEPIKIGQIASLSAYLAQTGKQANQGISLAVDAINRAGGVNGRPLQLITENDESDASKSVVAFTRLVEQEKVVAVFGPQRSDGTGAIAPLAKKNNVPLLTFSFIVPEPAEYVFSLNPLPEPTANQMAQALKQRGVKRVATMNAIDLYSKTAAESFTKAASAAGLTIVGSETFNQQNDRNFIAQLGKLNGQSPEWLALFGGGAALPLVVKQSREVGLKAPIMTDAGTLLVGLDSFVEATGGPGGASEGLNITSLKAAVFESLSKDDPTFKRLEQFREDFKAKNGAYPNAADWWIVTQYDSVGVVAEAIRRSGASEGPKLVQAIEAMNPYQGVTAAYSFGPGQHGGLTSDQLITVQIQSGKLSLSK
ncbi:MAG: ABC transporter substrate-binding protein [Chloroflexi bacterium]|nr:ABC transporter substrate-binding protein [Chloroflexota bacterium]